MANRYRGEIEADIGGARRRLVLTLGALAEQLTAFAAGGVISAPAYFPRDPGGLGGGTRGDPAARARTRWTTRRCNERRWCSDHPQHITPPDVESFRRSDAYITGQIARAVARGQSPLIPPGTFRLVQVRRYRFRADNVTPLQHSTEKLKQILWYHYGKLPEPMLKPWLNYQPDVPALGGTVSSGTSKAGTVGGGVGWMALPK